LLAAILVGERAADLLSLQKDGSQKHISKWQPSTILDFCTHIWTTCKEYLVIFTAVQNLVGIDAVGSKYGSFNLFLENAYSRPFWVVCEGLEIPNRCSINATPKGRPMCHHSSSGV